MEVFLYFNETKISLGYQALAQTIQALPDSPTNQSLYDYASTHPSYQVREAVASKTNLSEATIIRLAQDQSITVLRNLVHNPTAQAFLDVKLAVAIVHRDAELAQSIAYSFECWNDKKQFLETLKKHPDPTVRNALACNSDTPKPVLGDLAMDEDANVMDMAKQTLR